MKRPLTERELQVLRLTAEGHQRSAVAQLLFLSENTVKSHMSRILKVLGAHSAAHAVAVAMREKLLDPPGPEEPEEAKVQLRIEVRPVGRVASEVPSVPVDRSRPPVPPKPTSAEFERVATLYPSVRTLDQDGWEIVFEERPAVMDALLRRLGGAVGARPSDWRLHRGPAPWER